MSKKAHCGAAILRAAEAVVAQSGAAHLTLDAVAEKAGISKGGLLYHYPTKEALLQGMVTLLLQETDANQQKFRAELGGRRSADLEAHIRVGFKGQRHQKKKMAAALLAAGANDPRLLKPVRSWHLRNYQAIARTKRNPIRAALIMMAVDGLWLNDLLDTSPLTPAERKKLMAEMITVARSAA